MNDLSRKPAAPVARWEHPSDRPRDLNFADHKSVSIRSGRGVRRRLFLALLMLWVIAISHSAARLAPAAEPVINPKTGEPAKSQVVSVTGTTHNIPRQAAPELQVATWVAQNGRASQPRLRGKVQLVVFWDMHCQPCLRKIPRLRQLAAKHTRTDLVIVGVHNAHVSPLQLQNFARDRKLNYLVAIDRRGANRSSSGLTTEAYNVRAIPHAAVVDRDGSLKFVGNFDQALAQAEALVN